MTHWNTIRRLTSTNANVLKYVFEGADAVAESVLYKFPTYEARTVICCSTQSGCPIGCRFCGAGDAFVRSLTADEIVSQPEHLFADHGIDVAAIERLQIMFMSMGEPLLNMRALSEACERLYAKYPNAALLISTSGPRVDYGAVRGLSTSIPTVGLQFSVHESTDAARDRLIPFTAKLTLAEIAREGELWHAATGRAPFFNYCVHAGNGAADDADRLWRLFDPSVWQATISVVCERDEHVSAANERQRELTDAFQTLMIERGFSTRVFDPAGQDDIGGGCGQLWFVQQWMRDHPEMARASVGRRLPIVHSPQREGL